MHAVLPVIPPSSYSGFSLIELSVVLALIALVVGMSLSAGSLQLDMARFNGTNQKLETVRAALNLFQKKMGRYPCPAEPQLASSHANYGVEYSSGSCTAACPLGGLTCGTNAVIGMVPFKALGLPESLAHDSWDYRLTYAVDKSHTASSEYELGTLPIQDGPGNEITASPVLGKAIYVLLSHGMDRNGGNSPAGTLKACGATAKDIENCDGDDIFMDALFNNGTVAAQYFDDLVAWQRQENYLPPEEEEESATVLSSVQTYWHTCAIKADTTVWCWGLNDDGQLGDNSTTNRNSPVQAQGLTGVVQLAYMQNSTCALKNDGTVYCWGSNWAKQLGDGTTTWRSIPTAALVSSMEQLSTVRFIVRALKSDETFWYWGDPTGDPFEEAPAANVVQQDIGEGFECYLKSDGTVWCQGDNYAGCLGDGTTTDRASPVQTQGLTGVTQLAIGNGCYSCALKSDGTVWCWGLGGYGSIGDGAGVERDSPVQVSGLTGVTMISGASCRYTLNAPHFCAVKNDNTLWCWGGNWSGSLGNGDAINQDSPVQANITNVKTIIATGIEHTCVQKNDDTIWCVGEGSQGELGNGASSDSLSFVQVQNFP